MTVAGNLKSCHKGNPESLWGTCTQPLWRLIRKVFSQSGLISLILFRRLTFYRAIGSYVSLGDFLKYFSVIALLRYIDI